MMHARIKGQTAELCWRHRHCRAAILSDLDIEGIAQTWTVRALAREVDDFRVSQHPLKIVMENGWHWHVQPHTLQITDGVLSASLSPEE
jgi:hypothetical protein